MPAPAVHIAQAKHNEQLAEFLAHTPYRDWLVVSTFYAALHYLQAYFDSKRPRIPCRTHSQRDEQIRRDDATRPIYDDYRDLKDLSEDARYEGLKPSLEEIKEQAEILDKIKKRLRGYLTSVA